MVKCEVCKTKIEEPEYKIYEGNNLQEAMNKLLADGRVPLNLKDVWKFKNENNDSRFFDTITVHEDGEFTELTIKEYKNLKSYFDKHPRARVLGAYDYSFLDGNNNLHNNGRFLGVKKK